MWSCKFGRGHAHLHLGHLVCLHIAYRLTVFSWVALLYLIVHSVERYNIRHVVLLDWEGVGKEKCEESKTLGREGRERESINQNSHIYYIYLKNLKWWCLFKNVKKSGGVCLAFAGISWCTSAYLVILLAKTIGVDKRGYICLLLTAPGAHSEGRITTASLAAPATKIYFAYFYFSNNKPLQRIF